MTDLSVFTVVVEGTPKGSLAVGEVAGGSDEGANT